MINNGSFVFRKPRVSNPTTLLFNDEIDTSLNASMIIDGELPSLVVEVTVKQSFKYSAQSDITLSDMTADCVAQYVSGASRPTVCRSSTSWSGSKSKPVENSARYSENMKANDQVGVRWQTANRKSASVRSVVAHTMIGSRTTRTIVNSSAEHTTSGRTSLWQQMSGTPHIGCRSQMGDAIRTSEIVATRHQVMLKSARPQITQRYSDMTRKVLFVSGGMSVGIPYGIDKSSAYQDARKAPLGKSKPIVPPIVKPDYTPSGLLLFYESFGDYRDLLFRPTPAFVQTVVVPIKRSYIVLNEIELRRVDGNLLLPATSLQLKIDMDSWTWSFSVSMPRSAISLVEPGIYGDIVMLEAKVNGQRYRLIAEDIQSDRQFGQATISVSGRGISAQLSEKYSPTLTFSNSSSRTAQQLMNDALTLNGVSLGWDVDWRIEDWLVPAGAWSHYGTYMSAVNEIAAAAGAFIQPDPVAQILRVRAKYPTAPWNWGSTKPDIELPSAVVTKEAISWTDNPVYNAVYVSGSNSAGILAHVKRQGTAGDKLAPMITDALNTGPVVARQRGICTLAETGRNALYSLSLPVLPETGIIEPGSFVRYVDSNTVMGIVKGVSINASSNDAKVRQTIEVRTHG